MKRIESKTLFLIGLLVVVPAMMLAASSAFASTVRVVVPAHDIARGEVIGESDLTYATVDGNALMANVPTRMNEIVGLQTRRVLTTGQPFRSDDLRRPIVVMKGQTITMQFSAPGVELSAMGGIGDTVTIQNPASYRMISGIVVAPGTVRATGPVSNLSSNTIARR
jgi:flagella basal body P-ring formation protein FlgA